MHIPGSNIFAFQKVTAIEISKANENLGQKLLADLAQITNGWSVKSGRYALLLNLFTFSSFYCTGLFSMLIC